MSLEEARSEKRRHSGSIPAIVTESSNGVCALCLKQTSLQGPKLLEVSAVSRTQSSGRPLSMRLGAYFLGLFLFTFMGLSALPVERR